MKLITKPNFSCSNDELVLLIMYTNGAICRALFENLSHLTVRANQDELFSTDPVP